MRSKYFDELGLSEYPYPYNQSDYPTAGNQEGYPTVENQEGYMTAGNQEDYFADKRDTYSLDSTFVAWWYEHLCLYRDINCIDMNYHKFEIDGETLTFGQCVDRMIEDCKGLLQQFDENFLDRDDGLKDDLFKVLKECFWCLWW